MTSDIKPMITTTDDQTDIALTVYNDGTGLIREKRKLDIPTGTIDLSYMDVASQIDPTSVHFISRTDPASIAILEQNYQYDLVSIAELFRRHIDMNVKVRTKDGRVIEGILLAHDEVPVIKTADGIQIINKPSEVSFDELPDGLITRPTLKWLLRSTASTPQDCEMSYLTDGLKWTANYVAVVNRDDTQLDLSGWVTINNTSGASYRNATLKLVAGEIHRVTEPPVPLPKQMSLRSATMAPAPEPQFEEESFFEYHLYTLQRPATVMNRQQKQISLLEGDDVPAEKVFRLDIPGRYFQPDDTRKGVIKVLMKFENKKEAGLGIPLPKGKLRVYKKDSSDALQFIGEDKIDHTPKDEEITVFLGEAFDITGERTIVSAKKLRKAFGRQRWEYTIRINLKNHKDDDIVVEYVDRVLGFWEIEKTTIEPSKQTASTVEFQIPVKADGEAELEYTIRREW